MRRLKSASIAAVAALGFAGVAPGAAAVPLVYAVVAGHETASGPPYPTSTIDFRIGAGEPPDPSSPILKFKLDGASLPVNMQGSSGGPAAAGAPGPAATINFRLAEPPDPSKPVLIVPCVDVLMPDGTVVVLQAPPDPVLGADHSFIDVFFSALLGDGSVFNQRIHYAIAGGQDFSFDSPNAALGNSIDMSFLLTYGGGAFEQDAPVFTATISGTQVPEPAALALFGIGLAGFGAARRRARRYMH